MTTLSLEEFEKIDTSNHQVSDGGVLSLEQFNQLESVEKGISSPKKDDGLDDERNIFQTMAKGTGEFFSNIGESFSRGNEGSNISMMSHHALIGEFDYNKDIKNIKESFNKRLSEDPIKGNNWLSNAIYSVSGMIPAMGKGLIHGKAVGAAAGTGALLLGQAGPQIVTPEEIITVPAAFTAGSVVGSMNYWYQLGSGDLYGELKDQGVDDRISKPIAHIGGAMYGAVEFLQVDKLIPGSKEATKKLITSSIKRTVANLVKKHGVNWISEVGEEGLQEVIMTISEDIGTQIAGITNKTIGAMASNAMQRGWAAVKDSAIPLLLLGGPSAVVDAKRIADATKKATVNEQPLNEVKPEKETEVIPDGKKISLETEAQINKMLDEVGLEEATGEQALGPVEVTEGVVSEQKPPTTEELLPTEDAHTVDAFIDNNLKREIQVSEKKKDELALAEIEFEAIKEVNDFLRRRINKSKNPDIAEEVKEIPSQFATTKKGGLSADEALDEINNAGLGLHFDNLREMTQFLQKSIEQEKIDKQRIRDLKPRFKKKREDVILKEKMAVARRGFVQGKKAGRKEVKTAKEITNRRRTRIKAVRDFFQLSDDDLKKITRRDFRLMDNYEFKLFLNEIEAQAAVLQETREKKNQVTALIREKELQKVENLQKSMNLPSLNKMNTAQLTQFNDALEEFETGDEFLSLRKLETVDNTDLAGIKTIREAKEKLAEKLGVPLEAVNNIKVSALDKFLFDTALARRNPFYKFLVDETNTSMLDGEKRFLATEREVDDLTIKARKSRKRSLTEKLVPSDEIVFSFLEAPNQAQIDKMPEEDRAGVKSKESVAETMTDEEIDLANYLQSKFADFRDYLLEHKNLDKYQSNYITHIRRGFLETWKEDGILAAFKDTFKQYVEDEATFKVLDDDTENILPLEKFFQFAMQRSGNLKPSRNVAKAFKAYTGAFYKKQSLDKIVPALDIYSHILSPKESTPRGLQMNRQLIKFVKEWVNTKKGRKSSLGGIMPQNGAVDIGLRTINNFVTLIDLGLNIPVGITVQVGEQITTFANLGTKKYALGITRMNTKKGKQILKDNEAFVGKSPWRELQNAADDIGDKFNKGLYLLFDIATTRANKIHLLGSMTKEEWADGGISIERQALLKREIGRFRSVQGAKSIFGATSAGSTLTKYKTWALPILNTVVDDARILIDMIRKGEFKDIAGSREFNELFRSTIMTAVIALAGRGLVDDDDDSFIGEIVKKAYRESMTILGALDPTVLSSVRLSGFLEDISRSIKQIIQMEEYKTKSGLKGVARLKRTLTPRAVKQAASLIEDLQ